MFRYSSFKTPGGPIFLNIKDWKYTVEWLNPLRNPKFLTKKYCCGKGIFSPI